MLPSAVDGLDRRRFLQRTAASAAVVVSGLPLLGAADPNARLGIGIIGAGGRGTALMKEILALAARQNVRIAAVCDVWRTNRDRAVAAVKAARGEEPRAFSRYADLLELPGLDAVTIATPDFSHGTILVAALEAGKDVYIEKPMTIDLASANQALDLARARQRVVQAGTQRRSDGKYLGAAKFFATGALGQVSRFSVAMNFNESRWIRNTADCRAEDVDWEAFLLDLPQRPFDAKLLRQWQLYRATSNGLPGLWMTHFSDTAHLVTGAKAPSSAVAHGGIYVRRDGREHTDTFVGLVDYAEGFLFSYAMGLGNAAGTHCTVHGTEGTLDLERWTFTPEAKGAQPRPIASEPGQSHMGNWLECLRSRRRPNADIEYGHQHVVATVLAARALETGRRQRYNPAQRAIIEG